MWDPFPSSYVQDLVAALKVQHRLLSAVVLANVSGVSHT